MAREGIPNFVARKSKWTIVFRHGWKFFWPMLAALVLLIIVHLDTFGHPIAFLDGGHTPYRVKANQPTCTEDGNIQYYICWDCDKLYKDSKLTEEITKEQTVIKAYGHGSSEDSKYKLVHKDAVESTTLTDGCVEHWSCETCLKTFSDENGKNELASVIVPMKADENHKHDLKKNTETVDNACGGSAKITYYSCDGCSKLYADDQGESEIISFFGHTARLVEAKESTCTERGNVEHYKCTSCKKLFSDKACTNEVSLEDVQLGYGHTLHKGTASSTTKDKNGNKVPRTLKGYEELYFCLDCDRLYKLYTSDSGEIEVLRPFTIEPLGIRMNGWTLILAIYTFICLFFLICALIRVKCNFVEFYDDYAIQRRGVFWKKSRKTIFPQVSRVSVRRHFFNYGDIYIDSVGPQVWDIDQKGYAKPETIRAYLVDHMINPSAVENISNNPYIAALGVSQDSIF